MSVKSSRPHLMCIFKNGEIFLPYKVSLVIFEEGSKFFVKLPTETDLN